MYIHLSTLTNIIISEYFKELFCVFVISDNGNNLAFPNLPTINYNCSTWEIDSGTIIKPYVDFSAGCKGIVIDSTEPIQFFEYLEYAIRYSKFKVWQRRYLILPHNNTEYMLKIFERDPIGGVSDVLVIMAPEEMQNANASYSLINPFSVNCIYTLLTNMYVGNRMGYLTQDVWFSSNRSFLFNKKLYPNKISNMEGKTVIVSAYTHVPYSVIGRTFQESHGFEILIIAEYLRKINATPVLKSQEKERGGYLYQNGTNLGVAGDVYLGTSEIGLGGWHLVGYNYEAFYVTTPTYRAGTTCVVPRPKLWTSWLVPIQQFSWKVWVISLFTLIANAVGFFLTIAFKEYKRSGPLFRQDKRPQIFLFGKILMGVFGLFVGQCMSQSLLQSRRIFVFCSLFYLIVATLYSSNLSSKMVTPRFQDTIDTVEDLVNSDVKITQLFASTWILPIDGDTTPLYRALIAKFNEFSYDDVIDYSGINMHGFPVNRLESGHIVVRENTNRTTLGDMRTMGKDLYWTYSAFILKKGSILIPSLNKLILILTQAGLISYWESQEIMLNSTLRLHNILLSSTEKYGTEIKLKWMHVKGTFAVLFIGITMSVIVFISEILISLQLKSK